MPDINFNYERAIRQAERLEALSSRLQRVSEQDMERMFDALQRAWRSESAPAYLRKGEKVEAQIQALSKDLRKTARAIRDIAEELRAAEMEARMIADEY
ncbi:MAG: hypothetical protein IJK52_01550 [Oscillospiraceae bacterium]|nr:hypothetical protein [Oscillospiraceae bacterium]